MLLATGTTLNIQSFMGAIMAIGIAVANSILLVSFSEAARRELKLPVLDAAREGAVGRLRAVLMTASAMIMGMVPMALGLGRERGAISAARPCRHRRPDRRDVHHADRAARHLCRPAAPCQRTVAVAQSCRSGEPSLCAERCLTLCLL